MIWYYCFAKLNGLYMIPCIYNKSTISWAMGHFAEPLGRSADLAGWRVTGLHISWHFANIVYFLFVFLGLMFNIKFCLVIPLGSDPRDQKLVPKYKLIRIFSTHCSNFKCPASENTNACCQLRFCSPGFWSCLRAAVTHRAEITSESWNRNLALLGDFSREIRWRPSGHVCCSQDIISRHNLQRLQTANAIQPT